MMAGGSTSRQADLPYPRSVDTIPAVAAIPDQAALRGWRQQRGASASVES
jgi:hypothetical protein